MSSKGESGVAGPSLAAGGTHNKRPTTILVYPTVSPESIVIPIISCILGFPLLALLVICCLRRRAKLARERERRRAGAGSCGTNNGIIINFSSIHRLAGSGRTRAITLRSERAMSRTFPSMELDTVMEERSDPDPEITTDILVSPES